MRASALESVAFFGSKESAAFVRPLLLDPDPSVREAAAVALAELGDKESAGAIAKLLDQPESTALQGVCRALGHLGVRESAAKLQALVGQSQVELSGAAIQALAMLEAKECIPSLLAELDRCNGPPAPALFDTRIPKISAALGRFPAAEVVPQLLMRLHHRYAPIRAEAAAALGTLDHPGVVAELIRLLDDGRPSVRMAAAQSLGRLKAAQAVGALRRNLGRDGVGSFDDVSAETGAYSALGAIEALTRLGAREAAPELLKALRSVDEQVRTAAFGAIGQLRLRSALPEILTLVTDPDRYSEDGIPIRPEGRGRIPGNLTFGSVWVGTSGGWGSVFMPDLVAELGADEYIPDLIRMLPWLSSSERLSVAADLARLGSDAGVPIILRAAEWGDGSGLWALNALRKPALWSRLKDRRFTRTRVWWKRDLWAELGTALGVPCEAPQRMLWGWTPWLQGGDAFCDLSFADSLEKEGTAFQVIRNLAGTVYSFIVDDDRIRVVRNDEALAVWRDWYRKAEKKSQDK